MIGSGHGIDNRAIDFKSDGYYTRDCMASEYEYLLTVPDVIEKNLEKWMAIVGKEVVAVGDSAKEVFMVAKQRFPDKEPFIARFPKETAMLL